MKKLLLLISIVFCFGAKGQTNIYQPWPTDSSMWVLDYYPHISSPNPPEYFSTTVWLGDTVINTKTYTKIFYSNGLPGSSTYTYTGGVRQDIPNEKLYMIGTSGLEYKVFNNQHLIIGDTFPCFTGNAIVSNIDSVLIKSKYHKRYNDTLPAGSGILRQYIVGVGPVKDVSDSYYYNIWCFLSDTTSNNFPCILPTTLDIKQHSANNGVSIYPNPTNGSFTIKSNTTDKLIVDLYDVSGRQVLNKVLFGTADIDGNSLDNGVYTLTIKSSLGTTNKKLIIAH